jgi:hypothetical protein
MQTLKEPENLQLTFPDGTVLSSGDLVLSLSNLLGSRSLQDPRNS